MNNARYIVWDLKVRKKRLLDIIKEW